MECTQRLECTQDANDTYFEKPSPDQIGFLGICGSKHPIKRGPNKVGRDPQTCNIILNDCSISRQHAVINILNKRDFMLMDLDSSNKTKLLDKTLQPYIPHPLKNGDTVQFGQVFGIFRLLEEDDDLPMTQAVEIPDTPINIRCVSRLKPAPITTVPESPDVSDRDESIIAQSPSKRTYFKSPNRYYNKSSGRKLGPQAIETNKIDNVYWSSSKKSDSFSCNFGSNSSYLVNKSSISAKKSTECSIYDMETQAPAPTDINETSDSIYEANTQVPNKQVLGAIHNYEEHVLNIEKLPEVFKVRDQSNVQLNLYSTNKNFNIFEAETQVTLQQNKPAIKPLSVIDTNNEDCGAISNINKKLNSSDEEICFDEIDCEQFEEGCGSQPLLPSDPQDLENLLVPITNHEEIKENNNENKTNSNIILSDSDSKDCEIPPSQVVSEKPVDDEDLTDFEDNILESEINIDNKSSKNKSDDDITDCEDDSSNGKVTNEIKPKHDLANCDHVVKEIRQNIPKTSDFCQNLDDLPTQVITTEDIEKEKTLESGENEVPFEDMLTQVIEECPVESNIIGSVADNNKPTPFEDLQTQVIEPQILQERSTPKQIANDNKFKRPLSSPRFKKGDVSPLKSSKLSTVVIKDSNLQDKVEDDQNYYDATQQILDDLCTQNERPEHLPNSETIKDTVPRHTSESKRHNTISNLSKGQVREVIRTDVFVSPFSKKKSSDSSDLEITPKKFNPSKFLMIELPNSQDIKSCDFVSSKIDVEDCGNGFEDAEDQDKIKGSPRTYKGRRKKDVKLDLMKKFDDTTLPTRVISRIRKPTSKILDSDSNTKKMNEKILQSNLGFNKEIEIDSEIIQLNLKRLRTKMEKSKSIDSYTKPDKDEKNVLSKQFQKDESLHKNDKKESKKSTSPQKKHHKDVKQQNIKTMFEMPKLGSVMDKKDHRNVKTDSKESHNSRRSSRNKAKRDKKGVIELDVKDVKSEHSGRKTSSSRYSTRNQVEEIVDLTQNQEVVVRRSRRHQTANNKNEDKKEKSRRNETNTSLERGYKVTSKSSERSAVYDLSSEAAVDSPTSLKRQATSDISPSKTKKAKPSNPSGRVTTLRGIRTQYVLFTAFPCEEVKSKLEKLGAVMVSDVKTCTVVLTLKIRRTFKLLCAMGLGKPIVGPNWVQACADSHMIVDPWLYLMKDEATEKRFGFNLRQSLTCKRNFLKGYNISCTPSVTPNAEEMKSIVECSGGTWREGGRNWYCVTCPADRTLWSALRRRGAVLVSTEFILGGVIQQKINIDRDKLP